MAELENISCRTNNNDYVMHLIMQVVVYDEHE